MAWRTGEVVWPLSMTGLFDYLPLPRHVHGQQGRWSDPFTDWIVYFFQHAKPSCNMKQNIKHMNHAFFSWNRAWQGTWFDYSFFFVGWEFQPAELPLPVAALYGRVFPSILKSTIFRLFALVLPRRLMPVCSVSFLCVVCFQCIFWCHSLPMIFGRWFCPRQVFRCHYLQIFRASFVWRRVLMPLFSDVLVLLLFHYGFWKPVFSDFVVLFFSKAFLLMQLFFVFCR